MKIQVLSKVIKHCKNWSSSMKIGVSTFELRLLEESGDLESRVKKHPNGIVSMEYRFTPEVLTGLE